MEDIYNKSMWKPCCLVARKFTAFKIESGAAYINTRDGSVTKATPQTPMVVKDEDGVLWTEAVEDFCLHYTFKSGEVITPEYLSSLDECSDISVIADTSKTWYSFHVLPSKYGFDCPLGANKADAYNGDGDYFICKQINNLRLQDIKIMRTETFNVLYKTKEESMGTFEFKDSKWYWDGQAHNDSRSALNALCNDIVKSGGSLLPTFGDLGNSVDTKLQLIWAIYNQTDMESYLIARTDSQFEKMTRTKFGPGSRQNRLCAKLFRLPMTYESNRVMQVALFPALEKVYKDNRRTMETAVGKYSFEKTFSYICDDVLFSLGDSPFDKWLDMLSVLDNFEPTRNLSSTMRHGDIDRLNILVMQVKEDDIPVDCTISIGDVRKCRYPSKIKEELGDVDYVDSLLCSPPAVHCDSFYEWVDRVFGVRAEVDKVADESELPSNEKIETTAESKGIVVSQENLARVFNTIAECGVNVQDLYDNGEVTLDEETLKRRNEAETAQDEDTPVNREEKSDDLPINKPEEQDIIPMHNVAYVYCNMAGADFDSCLSTLRAMGVEGWENFYRALPIYLRRMKKGVFEGALTEYCNILKDYYGSCELRLDV